MSHRDLPEWKDAVAALARAERLAVGCHINPDGDALGSLTAAAIGLRRLGKEVFPSYEGWPHAVPPGYAFLPGLDLLVAPNEVPGVATLLALDCGAGDRLGSLERVAREAEIVINIDHHPGNDNFGTSNIVATTASSTAELVTLLLEDLGVEIDEDIATCLYTGIVTDTGRFQHANTTPDTLRLAADLLACGARASQIALDVFESVPFGYLKLLGRVLERARLLDAEGFVYSWITQKDLKETDLALEETEKLVDLIRSTGDAEVAAMFKQQPDGRYRVSLRSKGPASVGKIARERGGGGHELAAGFTADDVDATAEEIRRELRS